LAIPRPTLNGDGDGDGDGDDARRRQRRTATATTHGDGDDARRRRRRTATATTDGDGDGDDDARRGQGGPRCGERGLSPATYPSRTNPCRSNRVAAVLPVVRGAVRDRCRPGSPASDPPGR
jgi:hypothetical protein